MKSPHPDDARHWAITYAELVRMLPQALTGSEVRTQLAERLEWWEGRLRTLLQEAPHLVSSLDRDRPANVRAQPRIGPQPELMAAGQQQEEA
jgi:hypothetical protein